MPKDPEMQTADKEKLKQSTDKEMIALPHNGSSGGDIVREAQYWIKKGQIYHSTQDTVQHTPEAHKLSKDTQLTK